MHRNIRILSRWNSVMICDFFSFRDRLSQSVIFLHIISHLLHSMLSSTELDILFDRNHLHKIRYSILVIFKILINFFSFESHFYRQSHHFIAGLCQTICRQIFSLQILERSAQFCRHWVILSSIYSILILFTIEWTILA